MLIKFIYLNLFSVVSAVLFSFNSVAEDFSLKNQSQAKTLHSNALNNKSSNPWHITNLYSKEDDSFLYHITFGQVQVGMVIKTQKIVCTMLETNGFLKEVIKKENTEYLRLLIIKCQRVVKLFQRSK